jgi:hypothetical protein
MHHSNPTDHAHHDLALIARHAAGDLARSERARAAALLADCTSCVELRRDLVAIAAATRALPAPFKLGRDLRLDAAQAERLRRGSWLRAVLRPFMASHSAVRPMAAAFTSLGVAGLLVATVLPSLLGGSAASAPGADQREDFGAAPRASAAAAPVGAPAGAPGSTSRIVVQAGGEATRGSAYQNAATGEPADNGFGTLDTSPPAVAAAGDGTADPDGPEFLGGRDVLVASPVINPLVAGSLGLLALGLLLFGLRFASRRLR